MRRFLAFAVATACALHCVQAINGPLSSIVAEGTHFEVGQQVGRAFRSIIQSRLDEPGYETLYKWAQANATVRSYNDSWYRAASEAYPGMIDELHGIANGSGIDFGRIWFLNTHHEVFAVQLAFEAGPYQPPDALSSTDYVPAAWASLEHCTDVRSDIPEVPVWGHNEDSGTADVNHTYLVTAKIVDAENPNVVLENFTAYSYAGTVAGIAFGWNVHGLVVSLNALFAKTADLDPSSDSVALPRAVINRALYAARSVDDALQYLEQHESVVSFSVNLGTFDSAVSAAPRHRFFNVEVDPMGSYAVSKSTRPSPGTNTGPTKFFHGPRDHLYHANDYIYLTTPQFIDNSSVHRLERLHAMPVPTNDTMVRAMLGDETDRSYPLYRRGSHGVWTMVSAIFKLGQQVVELYLGNPKLTQPSIVIPVDLPTRW